MGPQNGEPECPCKMRERRERQPDYLKPILSDATPRGCVCPIGAEAICRGLACPRNPPMKQEFVNGEMTWVRK